jgi:hypothetical protein
MAMSNLAQLIVQDDDELIEGLSAAASQLVQELFAVGLSTHARRIGESTAISNVGSTRILPFSQIGAIQRIDRSRRT